MGVVDNVKRIVTPEWVMPGEPTQETQPEPARLFHCDACKTTYVDSKEMRTCPTCESSLRNVPTERDLGHV